MSEETDEAAEPDGETEPEDGGADEPAPASVWDRTTAPQSAYDSGQVVFGLVVLVVGAAITFGLPLLLL